MLDMESQWIASILIESEDRSSHWPLLNIGSSVDTTNDPKNPWIRSRIFGPASASGLSTVNVDLKDGPGVDIVADMTAPSTLETLAKVDYKTILCANVLEHVPEPIRTAFVENLARAVKPGGYLLITVPHGYPLHPDPIDTGYRPTPEQLRAQFPSLTPVASQLIVDGNWYDVLGRRPAKLVVRILRLALPFYRPRGWLLILRHMPWLFRRFTVSCVLLRKEVA